MSLSTGARGRLLEGPARASCASAKIRGAGPSPRGRPIEGAFAMPKVLVSGVDLNYEEVGEGAPFIYIAATRFDSAKAWVAPMRERATGFRVILPDPRGMAGSAHVSSIRPSDWIDDLAGLLDALSISSVHLAAETLGTRIATRFAADHPDRVVTLILNAPIAYSSPSGDAQRAAALSEQRKRDLEYHHGSDWEAVNAFYLGLHAQPAFHEYFYLRAVAD